ncbi:MAG: cytochrome c family protein [Verrucomicrobiales bacterium]
MNPSKNVGAESCRDCHEEMVEAWEKTSHARSFDTLASSEAAEKMARVLSLKPADIPMTASCVRCHYTHEPLFSVPQPTAAISCESCHGGAVDWIDGHNRKSSSRSERVDLAMEKGMVHPESVFAAVKTCYECHVVDDEQLVNQVGHPAFSDGFEFLSWYSGEVKHNFLVAEPGKSVKAHVGEAQPVPRPRKRMLYLAGKLHHLAHTLAAMARASDAPVDPAGEFIRLENGRYTFAVQHALEVKRLRGDIEAVLNRLSIRQFAEALVTLRGLSLTTGTNRELKAAAAEVGRLTEQFCEQHDGSEFEAIDPILDELEPRVSKP